MSESSVTQRFSDTLRVIHDRVDTISMLIDNLPFDTLSRDTLTYCLRFMLEALSVSDRKMVDRDCLDRRCRELLLNCSKKQIMAFEEKEKVTKNTKNISQPEISLKEDGSGSTDVIARCEISIKDYEEVSQPEKTIKEVSQPEKTIKEVSQPEKTIKEVSQPEKTIKEVSQPEKTIKEVSQPEKTIKEVSQPEKTIKEVSQLEKTIKEVSQLEKTIKEVSQPEKTIKEVSQLEKTIKEVTQLEKTIKEVSQLEKTIKEVSQLEKTIKEVSQPEKTIKEVSQLEKTIKEVSQPEKTIKEVSQLEKTIKEVSQPEKTIKEVELGVKDIIFRSKKRKKNNLESQTEKAIKDDESGAKDIIFRSKKKIKEDDFEFQLEEMIKEDDLGVLDVVFQLEESIKEDESPATNVIFRTRKSIEKKELPTANVASNTKRSIKEVGSEVTEKSCSGGVIIHKKRKPKDDEKAKSIIRKDDVCLKEKIALPTRDEPDEDRRVTIQKERRLKKRKKDNRINGCPLTVPQLVSIGESFKDEDMAIFENTESWKNMYYSKMLDEKKVDIFFDDRQNNLVMEISDNNFKYYVILNEHDHIDKMKIRSGLKDGLHVLFDMITRSGIVRELDVFSDIFGLNDEMIQTKYD